MPNPWPLPSRMRRRGRSSRWPAALVRAASSGLDRLALLGFAGPSRRWIAGRTSRRARTELAGPRLARAQPAALLHEATDVVAPFEGARRGSVRLEWPGRRP